VRIEVSCRQAHRSQPVTAGLRPPEEAGRAFEDDGGADDGGADDGGADDGGPASGDGAAAARTSCSLPEPGGTRTSVIGSPPVIARS
jgi:hypothetical protein